MKFAFTEKDGSSYSYDYYNINVICELHTVSPRSATAFGGGGRGGANCAVYNINKAWSEASNDLNMQLINTTHPEGTRLPKHKNNNALGLGVEEMFDGGSVV